MSATVIYNLLYHDELFDKSTQGYLHALFSSIRVCYNTEGTKREDQESEPGGKTKRAGLERPQRIPETQTLTVQSRPRTISKDSATARIRPRHKDNDGQI